MSFESQPEPQAGHTVHSRATVVVADDRLSLMDVWRVLMKQRFIILGITSISIAAAAFYAFRTKPVYESVSRIEINPNRAPNIGLQSLVEEGESGQNPAALQTQILILQSESVILQTAQSLDLIAKVRAAAHKEGSAPEPPSSAELSPGERRALILFIKNGLVVRAVGGTQMVEIRYRNNDPKLATEVVNKLVETYIDEDLRSKFDRTMHVSSWLQTQLDGLKQEASDAQRRLADYQKEHNIVGTGTDETSNLTMQNLAQISGDLESAEADRIMKEARMREFETQDPDMVALMGDNPELGNLRNQLTALQTERAQLTSKYGAHHPRMQELKAQIDKVQASIDSEVKLAQRQVHDEYDGSLRVEPAV
jgi:uncharacterized protein involved in exopolysaccharide biosynthesis